MSLRFPRPWQTKASFGVAAACLALVTASLPAAAGTPPPPDVNSNTTPTTATTTTTPNGSAPSTTVTSSVPSAVVLQLLDSAFAAAGAQRGVSWSEKVSIGMTTISLQATSGKSDGVRQETISSGGMVVGHISTVLDGATAYFRADYTALHALEGFTDAAAKQEAGHWISAKRTNASQLLVYAILASGLTVSSLVGLLQMGPSLSESGPTEVNGQSVIEVKGQQAGNSTVTQVIDVRASGAPLPVELTRDLENSTAVLSFGPWGQPPSITVPPSPRPFLSSWLATG